ncbi:XRE family transcriptional regulator [Rathayibacter rathayi]|uniref:XRE family transcriptional regulator n=1 Tax=Rathayibacter rathayi TaxID=33887 RepID=A0ABD6W5N0_RATRA|nr:XRE family transcriptional regulator [Rathayibacter rathayi]MWV73694.1 helix-turn-helix domain-containing protein [Rathayibacter rathayi NCPPB 2980 = VKM Ac-1601]PPF10198.1 XRE family transcriptional regulator [Rathayibacter rathayi]PPF20091.1 XRE family transcriptional regulator [Rathayibacter rathayi]PPF42992.1 XRE family transcriptional regulator [Rathayibacter rathayi]
MEPDEAAGADAAGLGSRLRELRLAAGLSLKALAGRRGISASAVSRIERGATQPSVGRLIALVDALGCRCPRCSTRACRRRWRPLSCGRVRRRRWCSRAACSFVGSRRGRWIPSTSSSPPLRRPG